MRVFLSRGETSHVTKCCVVLPKMAAITVTQVGTRTLLGVFSLFLLTLHLRCSQMDIKPLQIWIEVIAVTLTSL